MDSFPPSGQPNLRGLLQREALGGPNLLGRFRPISFLRPVGFRTFMRRTLDQALARSISAMISAACSPCALSNFAWQFRRRSSASAITVLMFTCRLSSRSTPGRYTCGLGAPRMSGGWRVAGLWLLPASCAWAPVAIHIFFRCVDQVFGVAVPRHLPVRALPPTPCLMVCPHRSFSEPCPEYANWSEYPGLSKPMSSFG